MKTTTKLFESLCIYKSMHYLHNKISNMPQRPNNGRRTLSGYLNDVHKSKYDVILNYKQPKL